MPTFRPFTALLSVLLFSQEPFDFADAFSHSRSFTTTRKRGLTSLLSAVSDTPAATIAQPEESPYSIARGDGSTGGGGLPMPHETDEDGLVRPKVRLEILAEIGVFVSGVLTAI